MQRWFKGCLGLLILVSIALSSAGNCEEFRRSPLQVFIKDEGFQEKNIVKPRIYVENRGDHPVTGFDLYYYFTVERGKTPVIDTYYTPNCQVSLTRENHRAVTGKENAPLK